MDRQLNREILRLREYFTGKICTIFVNIGDFKFDDRQRADYFVGLVDEINEAGIWTTHTITKNRNFYFLNNVAAIIEEQWVGPDHPNYEQIKQEVEEKQNAKKKPTTIPKAVPQPTPDPLPQKEQAFVELTSIERLAKEYKQR